MHENIALEEKDQKTFTKDIKKFKKQIKNKKVVTNVNQKGVVLLSNIPPGFEELEMKNYFKQFGKVTNIRLIRSNKTGKTRGHAYIQFQYEDVAKVAAETMHNYLMFNHLLKAKFIPSNKKSERKFKKAKITKKNCASTNNAKQIVAAHNCQVSEEVAIHRMERRKYVIKKSLAKLKKLGIDYNFEIPSISKEEYQEIKRKKKEEKIEGEKDEVKEKELDKKNNVNLNEEKAKNSKKKEKMNEAEEKVIVYIDPNETEIEFKTPPNAIKKFITNSDLAKISKTIFKDTKKTDKLNKIKDDNLIKKKDVKTIKKKMGGKSFTKKGKKKISSD